MDFQQLSFLVDNILVLHIENAVKDKQMAQHEVI